MNNDLDKDYCGANDADRQAAYEKIWALEQTPQQVDSPATLEQLERSLQEALDHLKVLLLQKHLQASLDTPEARDREIEALKSCPGKLKNEGLVRVWIYTMSGLLIQVQARYYRRSCDRRKGKRYRGIYAGLI